MKQLVSYVIENLILDLGGNLSVEMVRDFLKNDNSPEGRALMSKLIEDGSVNEMMITLADCLKEHIRTGITDDVVKAEIRTYAES